MQKSNKLLIKMERSYVNTTDLENESKKMQYFEHKYFIFCFMVAKVGWDLWCVFLSKCGEKIFCEKKISFKSKNKCLLTNWPLFLWLRDNFSTLLRALNKKDWFNYSSNLPRVFKMQYIFCRLNLLERTLVYVFLFALKYISRIF